MRPERGSTGGTPCPTPGLVRRSPVFLGASINTLAPPQPDTIKR
jgi:hypothetical protein